MIIVYVYLIDFLFLNQLQIKLNFYLQDMKRGFQCQRKNYKYKDILLRIEKLFFIIQKEYQIICRMLIIAEKNSKREEDSLQIPQELIEKIKEQSDIVEIISEEVRLEKRGRNYIGLCPFHNDKNPSFTVSQDKQIYKCFSCGEAGNVLTFVMKYKKLNFLEAIKYLADKANIPLDVGSKENSIVSVKKQLIYKINVEAARYFFMNLQKINHMKDYFFNRGIKEETIKRFGLGYSLDNWNNLLKFLKSKGYKDDIILQSGLVIKSEKKGNLYDRFRNRVMFPVFNVKGDVIGFGGRVLDDSKPKYLNSPETVVFKKGINLYGLNFAVKNNLKEDYIIIVEGYMDLIALHQAGITNVVASLGTALTINQARLLKRYVNKVIISYDADIAGQTATLRGLEILRNAGFDVKVLTVPEGKDPDEFVRNNGKEAFLRLITVSYTHLTLPTILLVQISVVAVSLKKKKKKKQMDDE
eukprot:TRINITY_DN21722_c0_g1_i4.p1 TRINITY_DN21722_c0_g1~~TRINITY_DN21722_c0_g1_i4.p1  ORF type:complete len:470 (-),score=70.89 TRINITY_DN21722_c0_g1_i4:51-1460(-)